MPLNWKNIPSKWHLAEKWLNWLEKYDCWVVLNVSGFHPGPIAMMEPINDHSILLAQCFVGIKSTRTFFLHKSARNVRQSTLESSSFSSTTDKHLGRNLWVVVEEKKLVFDVSSPHEHLIWPVCLKFEIIAFDILTFSDVKDVDPLLKTFQLFSFLLLCNLFESLKTSRC